MAYEPAAMKAVEEKNVVPATNAVRMFGGSLISFFKKVLVIAENIYSTKIVILLSQISSTD